MEQLAFTPEIIIPAKLHPPIDVSRITKEDGVKKLVKELLNAHGWFFWMPAANGFGTYGVSDFNALKDGIFIAVETKFKYGKPTAQQKGYAAQVLANDCYAFCVNERNINHLAWWLESFEVAKQMQMRGQEVPAVHGSRLLNAITALTQAYEGE
jgi:hypothetical protein